MRAQHRSTTHGRRSAAPATGPHRGRLLPNLLPLVVVASVIAAFAVGVTALGGPTVRDRITAAAATQSSAAAAGSAAVFASPTADAAATGSPAAPAGTVPAPDATAAASAAADVQAADPPAGTPTAAAPAPATAPAPPAAIALAPLAGVAAPAPAAVNPDCTLVVPADPLSAKGLATPYELVAADPTRGECHEATAASSAFVQAAVITPSGRITLYNPLVVDQGQKAAVPPARASVPRGSTVAIWFGSNGDTLTLRSASGGDSLRQGRCVNGSGTSVFGQFAYCNAGQFFTVANRAIRSGTLRVPRLGTARDGLPCPTVRDFSVVDQDQSDNVNTHYLAGSDGSTSQPNRASAAIVGADAKDLANGSDNRLLTEFILPTLGCRSFTRPDQSNDAKATASLPLQELQAAAHQGAPVALVPLSDPMTLEDQVQSVAKTNLFRIGVDQPLVGRGRGGDGDPAAYCRGIFTDKHGIQRVFAAQTIYAQGRSPGAATSTNLFTFLALRASETFENLGCGDLLQQANPIHLVTDANGRVASATFGVNALPAVATQAAAAAAVANATATGTATTTPTATPTPAPTATSPATPAPAATPTGTVTPRATPTATATPTP